MRAGEQIVRWTTDGRGLYVRTLTVPTRVDIVDIATGRRTFWKELGPADRTGVAGIAPLHVTGDGRYYVYSYNRYTDDLYLVEGLK